MQKVWKSIAEVKKANKESGQYWFDPDAMRFFGSKIETDIIHDRYFITSEVNPSGTKKYTIREVKDNASIDTVGPFHHYESVDAAREAILS